MIDLHSHTTASDGQYPPAEQVALAASAGVSVLAVTDHDTVAGIDDARQEAIKRGLTLIAGIEISCFHNAREVHVLGHFVDPAHQGLVKWISTLTQERTDRMSKMISKLRELGIPVTFEEVKAIAGTGQLTRPHLAQLLVDIRVCSSIKDAFDRFLGQDRPACVPRTKVTVEHAVTLIHDAGGTATVAHPGSSRINRLELEHMAKSGLDGIEVVHQDHPPSQREVFSRWAKEFALISTAGSDFHGERIAPDRHFGSVDMGRSALEQLESRRP